MRLVMASAGLCTARLKPDADHIPGQNVAGLLQLSLATRSGYAKVRQARAGAIIGYSASESRSNALHVPITTVVFNVGAPDPE
jgi:hypothetical protein